MRSQRKQREDNRLVLILVGKEGQLLNHLEFINGDTR